MTVDRIGDCVGAGLLRWCYAHRSGCTAAESLGCSGTQGAFGWSRPARSSRAAQEVWPGSSGRSTVEGQVTTADGRPVVAVTEPAEASAARPARRFVERGYAVALLARGRSTSGCYGWGGRRRCSPRLGRPARGRIRSACRRTVAQTRRVAVRIGGEVVQ